MIEWWLEAMPDLEPDPAGEEYEGELATDEPCNEPGCEEG